MEDREARDFERHLKNCVECSLELGAFRQIRESVVAWRQESLSVASAPVTSNAVMPGIFGALEPRRPSAMAALRGFFDLSPLWMKGAIAFASVLFCIVSVLALARLFDKQHPAPVAVDRSTEAELRAQVKELQLKLENLSAKNGTVAPANAIHKDRREETGRRFSNRATELSANRPKALRRPLTRSEREQLAADLRLISSKDETDLDLLGERLNQ
jgi:hypothetical protein